MGNLIDTYLKEMINQGGSDLHLPSGCCPMIRLFGKLKRTDFPLLEHNIVRDMAMSILGEKEKKILIAEKNIDMVYELKDPDAAMNRFRTNIFYQKNGINIVFRGIPRKIPTLEELGLPSSLAKLTHHHQGMVLVTGPSGCGKTATLAALINMINQTRPQHIITVEEPIEYVFNNERSLIIQRQVRKDVDTFATALKACLREDPDVIMVGEMRDLETIQLAITAAETGHLVFSTLHTTNAIATINRIIDAFPQEQQSQIRTMFSESLRGVVSQQLLPRADGKGRIVAAEVLLATTSISNLIRENKVYQIFSAMQTGKKVGMYIMDGSLLELVKNGLIDKQEALDRAVDLKTMEEAISNINKDQEQPGEVKKVEESQKSWGSNMDFFTKFKNFREPKKSEPSPTATTEEELDVIEDLPMEKPEEVKTIDLELTKFKLSALLEKLVSLGGSDLHLESGAPPTYRIKGDINFSTMIPLKNKQVDSLLCRLMNPKDREKYEKVGNLDLAHEIPNVSRFRINILRQHKGIGAVFRIIPTKIPTIDQLNLPDVLRKISMYNRGIVIVTGPTGSGKSTTMAAMINHINNIREAHIITIEDPIEFTHPSIKCLVDHREVGQHTRSFPEALKAALREDPDIVLVGEMRDLETISLAMTAAETGVLVFGTLHTNSAPKTIDRIIDVFPSKQQEQARSQLSQSLRAVIAQQLIKTADGKGRVAVNEILICNTGISNLIREARTGQIPSFIQMGKNEGMQSMDTALIELAKSGKITPQAAMERALEKARVEQTLKSF